MARCEHCKGSGLSDRQGPDDDHLLDRAVLSAMTIDGLTAENKRLREALHEIFITQIDGVPAEDQWACARATASQALEMTAEQVANALGNS
jgi:hypothetical protein